MDLKGDFPTVVFPIETTTRELDSKLVMASALAAQGCRAIVGHKRIAKEIGRTGKRVVWQGKSLFTEERSSQFADRFINQHSAIMLSHDEGGIFQVNVWVQEVLKNHSVDLIEKFNRVCVWGERQKDVICAYPGNASNNIHKIKVTGTPRFDLCLPSFNWLSENKTDEKRARYGPFILACTRFGNVVHTQGQADVFLNLTKKWWPKNIDKAAWINLEFANWQRDVHDFADFVVLTKEIANNYPRYTVILRPHPSENLAFYEAAFASFKNIVVTREDNVLTWIRGAELVVHSNCTTGIEAVLAGRPVLNLLPTCEGRNEFDIEVAREAGSIAVSIDEALKKVGELLAGAAPNHLWSAEAQTMLHNLNHQAIPILVAETLNVIEEAKIESSSVELPDRPTTLGRLLKRDVTTYIDSKRLPLDPLHVEALLDDCRSHNVGRGRLRHVTAEYAIVDPT